MKPDDQERRRRSSDDPKGAADPAPADARRRASRSRGRSSDARKLTPATDEGGAPASSERKSRRAGPRRPSVDDLAIAELQTKRRRKLHESGASVRSKDDADVHRRSHAGGSGRRSLSLRASGKAPPTLGKRASERPTTPGKRSSERAPWHDAPRSKKQLPKKQLLESKLYRSSSRGKLDRGGELESMLEDFPSESEDEEEDEEGSGGKGRRGLSLSRRSSVPELSSRRDEEKVFKRSLFRNASDADTFKKHFPYFKSRLESFLKLSSRDVTSVRGDQMTQILAETWTAYY